VQINNQTKVDFLTRHPEFEGKTEAVIMIALNDAATYASICGDYEVEGYKANDAARALFLAAAHIMQVKDDYQSKAVGLMTSYSVQDQSQTMQYDTSSPVYWSSTRYGTEFLQIINPYKVLAYA
jgi:hypothetical protein